MVTQFIFFISRWLLFDPKDVPLLYPSYAHPWTNDPVFEVDLANPDLQTYPLLSETQPIECILEAGISNSM